ncbi:STT3 domain-containing protein [Methanotorris formicicus]|uniref:dolichyl-phosphooligosaccharide-protein glycotransferase n=1 Tax=Methanotorris formicicus Mc-S-70 TaxID=647171 RepID=H1KX97_9EURY|nr:STT3 domain-containing protein [Methanotorris formicicus]EHP88528.1 Oligosaccharyl transferase STT3 subunit [Methanotorris formicicus Mc-S-70]
MKFIDNISKNAKFWILILCIVILGFILRIKTLKYDLLLLADPWYHYAMIKSIVNNGYYIPFNNLSNHPFYGRSPNPSGLYWIPAILYWVVSKFYNVDLLKFVQIIPPIIGSLTVIPIYLIGKELKNRYLGITMAFVFAVSPIIVKSGLAGYYRGEVWMVFFGMFAVYYFLKYLNSLKMKFVFLSSVFTLLCSLVWNGWVYIPIIIGIIHFVYVIFKKEDVLKGFTIYIGCSLIFVGIWKVWFFYHYVSHLLVFLVLFGVYLFELVYIKYIKIKNASVYLGIFLLFGLFLILGFKMLNIDIVSKIISLILTGKIGKGPRIILTESFFSYWDLLLGFSIYIFLIVAFIVKIIRMLIKKSITFNYLLALALFVSSIVLCFNGVRYVFVGSLGFILPIGLIFSDFTENIQKRIINFKNYDISLKLRTVFSIFIFLILVSVPVVSSENQMSKITPYISEDWYKASLWMKDKDGKTIFTFWDQANWFIAISEKTVFTDTQTEFGNNPYKNAYVFCANYSTGVERLKELRANYVAVDKRTLLMWYWLQAFNKMDKDVKFNESFLCHLYYENISSKDLKLVFKSDDLKIYEVVYDKPVIYNVLCNNSKIRIYCYSPYTSKINATLKICEFNKTKVVFEKNFSFECYGDDIKLLNVSLDKGIYDVYVSDGEVTIKKVLVVR